MGLDMYLSARKYISGYEHNGVTEQRKYGKLLEAAGLKKLKCDAPSGAIELNVAYWRKANQVHDWFVREVQDGEDQCQKSYVEREKLEELVTTCKKVLSCRESAEQLLPTSKGFFFGETAYDESYFAVLEDTVEQVESVLNNPTFKKFWSFEYQASW